MKNSDLQVKRKTEFDLLGCNITTGPVNEIVDVGPQYSNADDIEFHTRTHKICVRYF